MKALTKRQSQILSVITSFTETAGYSPSYRELMQLLGLSSPATVAKHIQNLEKLGFVKKTGSAWRAIKPSKSQKLKPSLGTKEIAVIGSIANGQKLELFAKPSYVEIPSGLIAKNASYYGFTVKDSSFAKLAIKQSDLLVVETRLKPIHGEMILVNSKPLGIKIGRYLQRLGEEFLELETEGEIFAFSEQDFRVQGVLISLFRKFS